MSTSLSVGFVMRDGFQALDYYRDLRWLIGGLAEQGVTCRLLADPAPPGGRHDDGLPPECEVHGPGEVGRFFRDLELVHNWNSLFTFEQLRLVRDRAERDTVVVQSLHSHLMRHAVGGSLRSSLKKRAYLRLAAPWLGRIDALHVYSQFEVEDSHLTGRLARLPRFVAGLGSFPPPTGPPWEDESSRRRPGRRLVYFGRNDVYHKGLDLALEGFARCWARLPPQDRAEVELLVVGRASVTDAECIDAFVAAHEHLPIRRHGPCDEKDVAGLFEASDVFVYLSRHDGPPNPVRVALSLGRPVLISHQTNLGETVARSRCGWTTDLDPDAVAEAMLGALGDLAVGDPRPAALDAGRRAIAWPTVAQDYVRGYESLVRR